MARGFDSKSVEEQQLESQRSAPTDSPNLSPEEKQKHRERESLLLTIKRVEADLERSTNPQHRAMLERALDDLKAKLG
jgi:hypothetical protein